ncbi:MAG: DUF5723 family protein, partial [Bacteroidota bacterium]
DQLTVGGLLYYQDRPFVSEPAVSLMGRYKILESLQVGLSYSYRAESATNIGFNLLAKVGPINFLATSDNIVTAFRPKDSQRANIRLGLSLSLLGENQ